MKPPNFLRLASVSAFALGVYGWGEDTHQTVGYIAQQFLAPNALNFVQTTLAGSKYGGSLGPAAPWADSVRKIWAWSSPWHFIDAQDHAPQSCSVVYSRDCGKHGCIVSAIQNYTQRVNDASLSSTQVQEALMFLDHFIGDIHQPLHDENLKVGGNTIHVTCNGKSTNLHASWDTCMPEANIKDNYGSIEAWANALVSNIQNGVYSNSNWLSCMDISDSVTCATQWASEANAYNCPFVWSYPTDDDLYNTDYYTQAVPIIEQQVAMAGYRLAGWLNTIFDGSPMPSYKQTPGPTHTSDANQIPL